MEKTVKIFLASSFELVEDRRTFEIFLNRRNKTLVKEGVFLELVIWEDFMDAMSRTRLQDEYNKALVECDIFIMLFYTKVGKYTEEEFDTAYQTFLDHGKPLIFTYFKDAPSTVTPQDSLQKFKDRLSNLGHFFTVYKNVEGLQLHFMEQLEKLENKGVISTERDEPKEKPPIEAKPSPVIFQKIKMEVANGKTVDKILRKYQTELFALIDDEDLKLELIKLQGQSTQLAKAVRRMMISNSDATIKGNQINNAFLDVLNEIENT